MPARYSAEQSTLDGQVVLSLGDRQDGRRLRIARHGAALLSFDVPVAGALRDLADGYRSAAEILARPGSRFAIMAPFAGRIGDARYCFDGVAQDLQPGVAGTQRGSRHGFVRGVEFEVAALDADDHSAQVTLTTAAIRPQPGYPHAIDLAVVFTLDAAGLTLAARMRNVGDGAAPCFFGWHPYFRLDDRGVADWQLQIPARTLIRTDAELIVLRGPAAYAPVDSAPSLDFRTPRQIGDSVLDQEYTDLQADPDGRIRTRLRDPAGGVGIAVWQERGVMHAFTADTVSRPRRAIALEPMECMAGAFDRAECADAIRLLPGEERVFRCGVEVDAA